MPAVMNAADEVAVWLFLDGKLGFTDIAGLVGRVMEAHTSTEHPSLDDIRAADAWARELAGSLAGGN
jgi:1-deoxy-D-xylulose-5-phosphate reductoisomerase